jgi:hypothetical protein
MIRDQTKTGGTERRGSPAGGVGFRLGGNRKNKAETVRTVIGLRIETTT